MCEAARVRILQHVKRITISSHYFPAILHSDFRALWLAAGASSTAIWGMMMARAWIAFELTDSGLAVGAVTFAGMIPWVLAPLGGALADRFDRARVLRSAVSLQIVFALILATLAFTGSIALWHLMVLGAANGLLWAAVELPAQQALVPNTVNRAALMNAVLLFGLTPTAVGRLIGPIAGGPMLTGIGAGWIFVLAAVFYGLSILALRRVEVRSTGGGTRNGAGIRSEVGGNIREALQFLGRNPRVRLIIALVTVHCTFTMGFDGLLPVHVEDQFGGGAGTFGALLMGIWAGAVLGIMTLIMVKSDRGRGRVFFMAGLVSGVGLAWLGLAPTVGLALVGAVMMGAGGAAFVALGATFIQEVVPDPIRGGVMSVFLMFAGGIMPVMSLANGAASDVIDTSILIAVPAVIFVVILVGWSLMGRELRGLYRAGGLQAATVE